MTETPEGRVRRIARNKAWLSAHPGAAAAHRRKYRLSDLGRSIQLLSNARERAKRLGVSYDLTREWVLRKLKEPCALTGRQFDLSRPTGGPRSNPDAPSIDRIDNSLGYTMDNVRLVTVHANIARNEFSDEAFVALARDVIRTISSEASKEERSTTIPQGSRGQAVPKRTAPQEGDDIVSSLQ